MKINHAFGLDKTNPIQTQFKPNSPSAKTPHPSQIRNTLSATRYTTPLLPTTHPRHTQSCPERSRRACPEHNSRMGQRACPEHSRMGRRACPEHRRRDAIRNTNPIKPKTNPIKPNDALQLACRRPCHNPVGHPLMRWVDLQVYDDHSKTMSMALATAHHNTARIGEGPFTTDFTTFGITQKW